MNIHVKTSKRYWIKKLVMLERVFDDQATADILLVWNKFKPAAMVELSCSMRGVSARRQFSKKVGDLEKVFKNLGFHYQLHINYPKSSRELTQYSYVAKDRKTLKKLIAADVERNTEKRRLLTGWLLGYPKTAVTGFANGKVFDCHKLPFAILKTKEIKFLNFRLSKKHWREELKYVQKRAKEIKKISPQLYKKIVDRSGVGQF